jgi:8-oxo-dGTP diphosphatase
VVRVIQGIWQRLGIARWLILWLIHPKFSLGVNGYILNDDGQVWLQKHAYWENQAWGLVGGFMKAGESPEKALAREVYEETGMNIEIGPLLDADMIFSQGISLCYAARFGEGTLSLDKTEVLEARFFNLDSLPQPMHDVHRALLFRVGQKKEVYESSSSKS